MLSVSQKREGMSTFLITSARAALLVVIDASQPPYAQSARPTSTISTSMTVSVNRVLKQGIK